MFETQPGNPENMVELNQNETKVNKLRQKSIESIIVMTDISRKNKGKAISLKMSNPFAPAKNHTIANSLQHLWKKKIEKEV